MLLYNYTAGLASCAQTVASAAYNAIPTVVEGFVTDDLVAGGLLFGFGMAVGCGYFARKSYEHKTPISLKDGARCTLYTGLQYIVPGLVIDGAYYGATALASYCGAGSYAPAIGNLAALYVAAKVLSPKGDAHKAETTNPSRPALR